MPCKHLSRDDRVRLSTMLKLGLSFRGCACNLGYSPTAIANEVNENGGRDKYDPYKADKRAKERRREANQRHRKFNKENQETMRVISFMEIGWSPTQVIGRWQLEKGVKPFSKTTIYNNVNPDIPSIVATAPVISKTTIYNNVNPDRELCKLLPRKHNKYRRTKAGNNLIKLREEMSTKKSIDTRPKHIELRRTVGHWEGDTIIGKEKTARILTHVERKTGYLLAELLKTVSAGKIRLKSIKSFSNIPKNKRKTFTYDNGTEFSEFELIEKQLEIDAYFAHAYHSWERGTNENTNGLIRRYFPKGTLFSNIELTYFKEVINKINHRPRERLGFRSPYEKFWGVKIRTGM